uniref:DUF3466 family protein n=1 Tax=Thaumasiovibrio occultus TaxID=1891184 RepID=UPI000B3567FC|nr:DUF3466 family protein [Thaumasiovibrio occultus]
MVKKFGLKMSVAAVAAALAAPTQAALYKIVEVNSAGYGSAISEYDADSPTPVENCFVNSCESGKSHVAGEDLKGRMGIPYRDEVPYFYFYQFDINETNDLEVYCNDILGYSSCDSWAVEQYFALSLERNAWSNGYKSNSVGFLDRASLGFEPSVNTVVNGFDSNGKVYGISSAPFVDVNGAGFSRAYQKRGFLSGGIVFKPFAEGQAVSAVIKDHGQSSVFDSFKLSSGPEYYVGSGSTNVYTDNFNGDGFGSVNGNCGTTSADTEPACNNLSFVTNAFVFDSSGNGYPMVKEWIGISESFPYELDTAPQASVRGVAVLGDKPYGVGYTTKRFNSDGVAVAAVATVFEPKTSFAIGDLTTPQWNIVEIPGINITDGDSARYLNTTGIDVNQNGLVIGHVKLDLTQSRAIPNRSFVYKIDSGKNAALFSSAQSPLFFDGANVYASALNESNEIVGWVDSERVNEADGRPRRKRGFIYLYADGAEPRNISTFKGQQVWFLDDLTGGLPENNVYRIAQANDINNAGVISATALKCDGGYSSEASNATCAGDETIVPVQLVPIAGGDISPREEQNEKIERAGSWGLFGLSMLSLLGWRRRQ